MVQKESQLLRSLEKESGEGNNMMPGQKRTSDRASHGRRLVQAARPDSFGVSHRLGQRPASFHEQQRLPNVSAKQETALQLLQTAEAKRALEWL